MLPFQTGSERCRCPRVTVVVKQLPVSRGRPEDLSVTCQGDISGPYIGNGLAERLTTPSCTDSIPILAVSQRCNCDFLPSTSGNVLAFQTSPFCSTISLLRCKKHSESQCEQAENSIYYSFPRYTTNTTRIYVNTR